ncbi:MAG TPA: FGGY family carbohydrate kinase, partial [bacterium]|nr:FGGY family carbohydrate kinase [bacterium]
MPLLLGIDVGTTGAKALIIGDDGRIRGSGRAEYSFSAPRPGWTEQDPEAWWQGAGDSIRAALRAAAARPDEIAAVGLSGQMHSLVLLDQAGRVLRPAILWND